MGNGIDHPKLSTVRDIYVTLSNHGLTPKVYEHGQFWANNVDFLFFLITDYVPLTLDKIKNKQLKNRLLKRVVSITHTIHELGFINQDLHDRNFLYDGKNDILCAIDSNNVYFSDTTRIKFKFELYLWDVGIVTGNEIICGIY